MRKRSKYRPKPVITDPLTLLRVAGPADRRRVLATFYTALEDMARGDHPGVSEWRDLSDCINTVETMAETLHMLDAAEVMPSVTAAIAGMVAASKRYQAGAGMRLDAQGLTALRQVVDIYAQCLDGYTEREMARAQAETQRRVNQIMRSKSSSSTHEVIEL